MNRKLHEALNLITHPFQWSIRGNLIWAGFMLGILAIGSPFYVRSQVSHLEKQHRISSNHRSQIKKANQLIKVVDNCETQMRAYAATGDRKWRHLIRSNTIQALQLISDIIKGSDPENDHVQIISNITTGFRSWDKEIISALLKSEPGSPSMKHFEKSLLREPQFILLRSHLQDLVATLEFDDQKSDKALSRSAKQVKRVVLISAIIFFMGFGGFMFSLWLTIIPGLNALVGAAHEIKEGNFNYRVSGDFLRGDNETSALGKAFNEMSIALKEQNEKMTELNRIKTDFVSTVSHELRTPLTAIKGSIGLILGGIAGEIPKDAREMLEITAKNTDRLIRLINNVLDIAKIEAGAVRLQLDRYDLVDITRNAIRTITPFANGANIKIDFKEPDQSPLVVVDSDRVEQILVNLISNSVKFSTRDSTIQVRMDLNDDHVKIHVIDQGIGIAPQELDKLFKKFHQVKSGPYRNEAGTGLGLTICKALVEEHGGRIGVDSVPEKGSDFYFTLPWNGKDFAAPQGESTSAAA